MLDWPLASKIVSHARMGRRMNDALLGRDYLGREAARCGGDVDDVPPSDARWTRVRCHPLWALDLWICKFGEGEEQTRTGLKSHFTPRDNAAAASTRCVHSPTHPLSRTDSRRGKKCVARRRESAATPHDYLATRTKLIIIAPFSSASRASERASGRGMASAPRRKPHMPQTANCKANK